MIIKEFLKFQQFWKLPNFIIFFWFTNLHNLENIDFPNYLLFSELLNFTKLSITENQSIIILSVNYLRNWLIFKIRNFWNFFNWKFSSRIQNIDWSNAKDELYDYLWIYFLLLFLKITRTLKVFDNFSKL